MILTFVLRLIVVRFFVNWSQLFKKDFVLRFCLNIVVRSFVRLPPWCSVLLLIMIDLLPKLTLLKLSNTFLKILSLIHTCTFSSLCNFYSKVDITYHDNGNDMQAVAWMWKCCWVVLDVVAWLVVYEWTTTGGWCCLCPDLDECRLMPGACQHGRCINTLGSYRCLCDAGYQVDRAQRESQCVDVDECSGGESVCEFECRNTAGTFVCACPVGYWLAGDGRTCVDVDECDSSVAGLHTGCEHTCLNTRGSYVCACQDGYRLDTDQRTCQGTCSDGRDETTLWTRLYSLCSGLAAWRSG